MEPFFQTYYLGELECQCVHALRAAARLDACIREECQDVSALFFELHALLSHVASASRILWPPQTRANQRALDRGAHLRAVLTVPEDHPVRSRKLRNHLEHYDERLDAWIQESQHHNIATDIVGPVGSFGGTKMSQSDVFRQFDPATCSFIFRGEEFSIQRLVEGVNDLRNRIQQLGECHA